MGDSLTPYRKLLEAARQDRETIKLTKPVKDGQLQVLPFELPFKESKLILVCPINMVVKAASVITKEEAKLLITLVLKDTTTITKAFTIKTGDIQLNVEVDAGSTLSMRWGGDNNLIGSLLIGFGK